MKPLHLQKPDRALIRTYVREGIYYQWIKINTYVNGCSDRCRKSKDFLEILNSLMFELYAKISMIPDCPEYAREKEILDQAAIDYQFRLSDVGIIEIKEVKK